MKNPIDALAWPLLIALLVLWVCPPAEATETYEDLIYRQFEIYDPEYQTHREYYGERLHTMAEEIAAAEAKGRNLSCSHQMYLEAKWIYEYTAHWNRLEDKLRRIEQSLADYDQAFADEQSPVDGFWGFCYEEWFMRLAATIDGLDKLASRNEEPRYSLRSSGQFDTAKKLLTRLQDLLVSDIASTGVDNRGEFASLVSSFAQGAFKPQLRDILVGSIDLLSSSQLDSMGDAFRFFLRGAQDPTTGYWGAWYIVNGKIHKTPDLSMTFHIITYTKGEVEHWSQIIQTTWAIESDPYPYGWRHNGRFNNHNLYDVAKIYKFGWPFLSDKERERVAQQIEFMLDWSLKNTLRPDNTFIYDPTFSDSLADEYYFGVSFLDAVGYWRQSERFWTNTPVAQEGAAQCCPLKNKMKELGLIGWAADGALKKLEDNCGQC
jgi:hypothetical protein